MIGRTLAHYEVLERIGAGGMGVVYRARDTKLGRDVAIKVLPEELADNEERVARFHREARVLATLNHPGIAAIHGFEALDGVHFLALELVPGETLADRITRGPIPIDEALRIAVHIADALEEAHEQGVVHRDLKPANIKLTPDDKVKVLDFGLAKAMVDEAPDADSSMSPTITRDATRVGVILGTAGYMSPEQARGKSVDKRSDIFAFGAVIYEMVTGSKAFRGEDVSQVLASVINLEPDWALVPADVARRIVEILRRCLSKEPRSRFRDIGDVRFELEAPTGPAPVSPRRDWRAPALAGLGMAAAFVLGSVLGTDEDAAPAPALRLPITLTPSWVSFPNSGPLVALSPDASRIVYTGGEGAHSRRLYVRRLDELEASPLPGTEGAMQPAFSPDGEWVAFFAGRTLSKVRIDDGIPVSLAEVSPQPRGLTWGDNGTLVFAPDTGVGLSQVSDSGGPITRITAPGDGERSHRWPHFLPGSEAVVFIVQPSSADFDHARIEVVHLESGDRKMLHDGATQPLFARSGHLLFASEGRILASRFDPEQLELLSPAVPVLESVRIESRRERDGSAQLSVANDGTMLFLSDSGDDPLDRIVRVRRDGTADELGMPGVVGFGSPRVSPDGQRILLGLADGSLVTLNVDDGALSDFVRTSNALEYNESAAWSSDGDRIAFGSNSSGSHLDLHAKRVDNVGATEQLSAGGARGQLPTDWSPDDDLIAFQQESDDNGWDIWVLPLEGDNEPRRLVQTKGNERRATFSPDGRFVAYDSDESGLPEVYVVDFPGPGGTRRVSEGGGSHPVWNPARSELFYRRLDGQGLMVVRYEAAGGSFRAENPRELFEVPFIMGGFDTFPDGESFVTIQPVQPEGGSASSEALIVVTAWFDELNRLVPANR